ncbi:unnamed protein product [Closterium sp. Yama58-4]|nr:unnamed protein product [Closterium sp. Yama58-4]
MPIRLAHAYPPCPCHSSFAHAFPPLLTSSPPSPAGSYVDGEPTDDVQRFFKRMHATAAAAEAETGKMLDNSLAALGPVDGIVLVHAFAS